MVTIYGARSTAEAMIARVQRMHDLVAGTHAEVSLGSFPPILILIDALAGALAAASVHRERLAAHLPRGVQSRSEGSARQLSRSSKG